MDSEKIELRKLLFKHSAEASNLLRSDYNGLNTALTRYLNFIDGQPVTRASLRIAWQTICLAGSTKTPKSMK